MNAVDTYNKTRKLPCPKCGMDLVEREHCEIICTETPCGGMVISKETLETWKKKENKIK